MFKCLMTFALAMSISATCHAQNARDLAAARAAMVESDVAAAGVTNPNVLAAMRAVPRHEFVSAEQRAYAYLDMALPIGEHQTISPPFIVAYMTERLDPQPGDRLLEIGTGSGYQAAILGRLVNEVYTIEIIDTLANRAAQVFRRLDYNNIQLKRGDGYQGWAEHAPFDKIIVTCSPEKVPGPLVEQLREGGRIVIPLGERYQQTLLSMKKQDGQLVVESRDPTFFVPMTGQAESLREITDSQSVTPLANGDFEQLLEVEKPAGWYYLRQAVLTTSGRGAAAKHHITFSNRLPGRSAQALQAIGVDGRRVNELTIDLRVQAEKVRGGPSPHERARLLVSYFDENRVPLGEQTVGPWSGSFDWQRRSARLKVPPEARVAVIAIGLLGATGELSFDDIAIRQANTRTAAR